MTEVYAQTQSIRQELQQRFVGDIASLSQEQLRLRVAELVAELQERTKWEALRLHEALQRMNRESGEMARKAFLRGVPISHTFRVNWLQSPSSRPRWIPRLISTRRD